MEQISNNIVDIRYQQTGESSATNELGMREMQTKAYEALRGTVSPVSPFTLETGLYICIPMLKK